LLKTYSTEQNSRIKILFFYQPYWYEDSGRNTLYGKNPKSFKTPIFDHFHGGETFCNQNQGAEKDKNFSLRSHRLGTSRLN